MLKYKKNTYTVFCPLNSLIFNGFSYIMYTTIIKGVRSVKKILSSIIGLSLVLLLSACNIENEENSIDKEQNTSVQTTTPATTTTTVPTTVTTTATTEQTYLEPDDVIPPAVQTSRVEGDRLSYNITNVYSDDEYYTLNISGVKLDSTKEADIDTTYIKGELYGDFRLDLMKKGEMIDSFKINVPRDDRFLILESVTDDLSYGCELISNKREFEADEYPDLIQLDFHIINEVETPQYARFFAVFDEKIIEIPVFEDGIETAPYGTHLELDAAGVMTQHIVASQSNGNYTVLQYEYTFDIENRKLLREQVRFTG